MRLAKLIVFCSAVFLLATACAHAQRYPDRRVLIPYQSAAGTDNLWALRYNPGGLAVDDSWRIYFAHTYSDSDLAGNSLVYLGWRNLGLGMEWLGTGNNVDGRQHTIAWGEQIRQKIYIGTSYRWVSSDDPRENKAHFWTHSLMIRPGEHLSLAVRVDNFNHMRYEGQRTDALWTYSAGLNFADGKFLLGADFTQASGQRLDDGAYRLTAAIEPVEGLVVYGDYGDRAINLNDVAGEDHQFGIGVQLNLTTFMLSTYNAFNSDGEFFRGTGTMGSFDSRRRTKVRPRHSIADFRLTGDYPDQQPDRFFFGPAR